MYPRPPCDDVGVMRWSIVVPVKRLPRAKSRLFAAAAAESVPGGREALALALAVDTVTAALASPVVARVVVVTDDEQAADRLQRAGAVVVPDRPDAGLNPALAYGAAAAAQLGTEDGVAVLASDLAALRPNELTGALQAAAAMPRSFVADASGLGTTLLAAGPGADLAPRYGVASRQAHLDSGAVELQGDWPSLRRDVDTPDDLQAATRLGIGAATRALL